MVAHLHRYASEMKSLDEITQMIIDHHPWTKRQKSDPVDAEFQVVNDTLRQVHSQIRSIVDFRVELEKKIANCLALVSDIAECRFGFWLTLTLAIQPKSAE